MAIWPVIDARIENLPAILGALRPFMPFSSRNPRILPSGSLLAQTTNRSAMGELVIQVLVPCST
jgi:hypothetical protein